MLADLVPMVLQLVQAMSVVVVLAYVLTRTNFFNEVLDRKFTIRNQALLIIFFGAFSIFGTFAGFDFFGALINVRDLGPALAGFIGGPVAGLGAGLIGGLHRYTLGGPTCSACSLSTVLAGLLAGLVYTLRKGKLPTVLGAALFAVAVEGMHMLLALVVVSDQEMASITWFTRLDIIKNATTPMMVSNALGMAVFVFIVRNLLHEREVEGAKKLIEGELKVARDIQMGIVPKIFPPYPDRPEFDLYAVLEPAKEVGGDLYDFYQLDDRHLFFVLGDVSGKGVPASLFMAITVALFKANARLGRGPEEILTAVNVQLSQDNEACMFVTLFCGILDVQTGEVAFSNAGHNPPVLILADGTVRYFEKEATIVAGAMEESVYTRGHVTLAPGDGLLLYTDGVTEAMNVNQELYDETRLEDDLRFLAGNSTRAIVEGVLEKVHEHAGEEPQSDDITMLLLTYKGL